jgi:hypothetical protein
MTRRLVTREQVQFAADRGWTAAHAAREFGFHRAAFSHAAKRHGIELPSRVLVHKKGGAKNAAPPSMILEVASNARVKAFSASPAAIERALQAQESLRSHCGDLVAKS